LGGIAVVMGTSSLYYLKDMRMLVQEYGILMR